MKDDELPRLVFEALGEVSMCWDPPPGDQVFQAGRAIEVGSRLIDDIRARMVVREDEVDDG